MGTKSREKRDRQLEAAYEAGRSHKESLTLVEKLFTFFEHGWILAIIGVLGSVALGLIWTPAIFLFGILACGSFHRVKVVTDRPIKTQIWAHLVVFGVTVAITYGFLLIVRRSVEIIAGKSKNPLTVVYQTPPAPQGPELSISEPIAVRFPDGNVRFDFTVTDIGDETAKSTFNTGEAVPMVAGLVSEESIFKYLYRREYDPSESIPRSDIQVGFDNRKMPSIKTNLTERDKDRLETDKRYAVYAAYLLTYYDKKGVQYHAEACWIYSPLYPQLGQCNHHNKPK